MKTRLVKITLDYKGDDMTNNMKNQAETKPSHGKPRDIIEVVLKVLTSISFIADLAKFVGLYPTRNEIVAEDESMDNSDGSDSKSDVKSQGRQPTSPKAHGPSICDIEDCRSSQLRGVLSPAASLSSLAGRSLPLISQPVPGFHIPLLKDKNASLEIDAATVRVETRVDDEEGADDEYHPAAIGKISEVDSLLAASWSKIDQGKSEEGDKDVDGLEEEVDERPDLPAIFEEAAVPITPSAASQEGYGCSGGEAPAALGQAQAPVPKPYEEGDDRTSVHYHHGVSQSDIAATSATSQTSEDSPAAPPTPSSPPQTSVHAPGSVGPANTFQPLMRSQGTHWSEGRRTHYSEEHVAKSPPIVYPPFVHPDAHICYTKDGKGVMRLIQLDGCTCSKDDDADV